MSLLRYKSECGPAVTPLPEKYVKAQWGIQVSPC